jgi:UDP-2-acetamido-3-amino-2,3-dideoxy-glucuronate N-acetyltransferase
VIHPTAEVEAGARVGAGSRLWHYVHVRSGAVIGNNCNIGYGAYIDAGAVIGSNVKLQNRVSVYRGVTLEDGVFVGPNATFTNDKYPRAITPEGEMLSEEDWQAAATLVRYGASIGAGAVILPGITIGRWAMVGAGALVTRDVPEQGLVVGVPARQIGYACLCGRPLERQGATEWRCPRCHKTYNFPEVRRD